MWMFLKDSFLMNQDSPMAFRFRNFRLEYMIAELGFERMKHFHVHFSKIMYGAKGEIKHLTFEDDQYGPEFAPLASALKTLGLEPFIVSESAGTQAEDAAEMKALFNALL